MAVWRRADFCPNTGNKQTHTESITFFAARLIESLPFLSVKPTLTATKQLEQGTSSQFRDVSNFCQLILPKNSALWKRFCPPFLGKKILKRQAFNEPRHFCSQQFRCNGKRVPWWLFPPDFTGTLALSGLRNANAERRGF